MSQHDQDLQQEQRLLEHYREHSRGEPSAAVDALILAAARQAVEPPRPSFSQRLHAWLFGAGSHGRWSLAFASLATLGIGLSLTWRTQEQAPSAYDLPAPVVLQAPAPALQEMAPAMEARKQTAEREYKKAEQAEQSGAGSVDPDAFYSTPPAAAAPRQIAPAKPQSAPVEAMADSATAPAETDAAREEAHAKARVQAADQAFAKAKAASAARAKDAQAGAGLSDSLSEDQLADTLGHSSVDEAPPLELQLHNVLRMRQEGMHAAADRLLAMLKREHPQLDLDAELKRLQAELEGPGSSR